MTFWNDVHYVDGLPYRPLYQAILFNAYQDRVICLRDSPWAQILAYVLATFSRVRPRIAALEARLFQVSAGGAFPWYSMIGLSYQMYRLVSRVGVPIDMRLLIK